MGSGRGPTGRLRNFKAMNADKLADVRDQVDYENSNYSWGRDQEALDALNAEVARRFRQSIYA